MTIKPKPRITVTIYTDGTVSISIEPP